MRNKVIAILSSLVVAYSAVAAPQPITLKVPASLTGGYRLMAVSSTGEAKTVALAKSTSITPVSSPSRLYVIGLDDSIAFAIVNKVCTKAKSGAGKGKFVQCKSKNTVHPLFKAGANLGTLKVLDGGALLANLSDKNYKNFVDRTVTIPATNYVPSGITSKGLAPISTRDLKPRLVGVRTDLSDSDGDGLVSPLDADDDGDGILDNYDSGMTAPNSATFKVFSNFKLDIEQSINQQTTGLSTAKIDQAIQAVQTLAIQVAGNVADSVELDCGTLGYCSASGTGRANNQPFPGTAGGSSDADGDGHGTITRGPTGDFQLQTGASSSTIAAGDTLIQQVTDSSSTSTEVPGILNFYFVSNPAIKTVGVNEETPQAVNYSAFPILGGRNNCIPVPSGDVRLNLTGYRPQRPGVSAAGEGSFVDIGGSLITIDIPNGPCSSPNSGCSTSGPGNCVGSAYSTTDSNLTINANGLADGKSDQDTSATNTYSFTVDLSACLNNAPGGAVAWTAGQTLFVDLQFKSSDGDNAAQKFCVTKASS